MGDGGRIVLATAGSLGDLHPFIAVGKALQARGFRAEIAASEDYRAKVEAEGLGFHAVGPGFGRLSADLGLSLAEMTRAVARSDRFLFEWIMLPYLESGARQLLAAAEGCVAIAGSTFAAGAAMAAQRLNVPFVAVALQPTVVMSAFDPPFLPRAPWLAPARSGPRLWLNRATLALGRTTTAQWKRPINAVRHSLGLGPTDLNPVFDGVRAGQLSLGLYSPLLSPRQPDAPPHFEVTGYAAYDNDAGGPGTLSPALTAFLDQGPAPIVFTLGSAVVNMPGDFYVQSLAAARTLGRRAVFLVGPEGDLSIADGPDVVAVPYAPFSLLFPRCAAVVHQGGVGTTQQALRAGRPQLIVPHLGDQFDNGARVVRIGCGATLKRSGYRPERIVPALETLLNDLTILARCSDLGDAARSEDGAVRAADLIAAMIES
ncbi:nucleotide disphospho-sugar-binding domain-containing protein [uncultured Brevundimonas sp.]|uniref:glycosyltransferase n=1 Tax=uncultured Brevundimonas sp. TaxID=213418 RepID=UPI0030EB2915|tara:strand:+ start:724 stop:2013 length:1290 start_codon:yes stop_codon:yes gene_type:complete